MLGAAMHRAHGPLLGGLFLTTLTTLMLELLDSRLLSVLTWYHLAWLAVSLAMLGMSAGAIFVFLGGDRFHEEAGRRALARYALALALAIPVTHVLNLSIPIPVVRGLVPMEIARLALTVVSLALPFFLSGVVVTIALTRTGTQIGLLYGVDLLGAATGCLLVIPLLNRTDISSAVLLTAALAAAGALCFARLRGSGGRAPAAVCAVLALATLLNASSDSRLGVIFAKDKYLHDGWAARSWWNSHSFVLARYPQSGAPMYWGPSPKTEPITVETTGLLIDADAGTAMTRWDGRRESLAWVPYDVTSLPHQLRQGSAAVLGVGGGRDLLSALWAGSRVTGIEVNGILVDLLRGEARGYTQLVGRPDVRLVHDEARSYLSRSQERFDVIQMSLTDTWASTGAGAFTLSENGLYTVEAWSLFLDRLEPGGILGVSRWFAPEDVSETTRLLSLATATLLRRGVADPAAHVALAASGSVATLLVSNAPLSQRDLAALREARDRYGFNLLLMPGLASPHTRLQQIVNSRSLAELERRSEDPLYDYSAPTDDRPYFFNLLKPAGFLHVAGDGGFGVGGVVFGNLRATTTLVALCALSFVLTLAIVFYPLLRSGLPQMGPGPFAWSLGCFACIGLGFMLMQIPFLQRFSVYLGHPTYALSVVLFSMILFAGLGSLVSDRLRIDGRDWHVLLPIAVAFSLCVLLLVVQPLFEHTLRFGIPLRAALVVALTAPASFLAGFCFPLGIRLVSRVSTDATAWMWGANGACSVLGSVLAVFFSLWAGIQASLLAAALAYLAFAACAWRLERSTRAVGG
jgi:spermidine synthase